jgi:hypothetical protein
MKRLLFTIGMFMYAATEGNGGNAPETNDEKLARLNAEYKEAWDYMVKQQPGTDEAKKAAIATHRKQAEIDTVIAQIAKAAKEAELAEARNAKIAVVDRLVVLAGLEKTN